MILSAPAAAAARASGSTSSRRPAAWEGSTITGRCVSSFRTATAARSRVKRVAVSKVLMPRSQRMIRSFPSLATYSAAIGEQDEALHAAGADLDHVRDLDDRLDLAGVHQLGHDRQPGLLARLTK